MSARKSEQSSKQPSLLPAVSCLLLGTGLTTLSLQTVFTDATTAKGLISKEIWQHTVRALGGSFTRASGGQIVAEIDLATLFWGGLVLAGLSWFAGAWWISRRRQQPFSRGLAQWGLCGWLWWLVPGAWEALRLVAFLTGLSSLEALLLATPSLWYALMLAGWLSTFLTLSGKRLDSAKAEFRVENRHVPASVWLTAGLYVIVFTAMNWQLYRGLLVPHGDSAMYEEHLWNLTHGKGFRSYLDQGLFLGEHLQVIHLALIPLHLIWPSHLLLELCESLALASGAIPIFWLARRHTGSKKTACLLAVAYLLYFPTQFLDIAIDLKTFRPISFGVPVLLFALDQLERGRSRSMALLLLLALSAKEDMAIIIAPLGLWIAVRRVRFRDFLPAIKSAAVKGEQGSLRAVLHGQHPPATQWEPRPPKNSELFGLTIAALNTVYLWLAVKEFIPWFRDGKQVHYLSYFRKFGESFGEIVQNIFTDPGLLFGELVTANTVIYTFLILLPLGFLPMLSPGRLAVGLPLFGLLCLNEIAQDPRHHFHAPLIPVVFWAAAAGLGNVGSVWHRVMTKWGNSKRDNSSSGQLTAKAWAAHFVWTGAFATGLFFSLGPLGRNFWDPGTTFHWRKLYVPGKRAEMFDRIYDQIPPESCVASTDFVHPRFTHHERSYDYSQFPREVNNNQPGAPPDSDYIVIDTQHRYSKIKVPEQIPEYREHLDQWERLPDTTEGYFIVLKRKDPLR